MPSIKNFAIPVRQVVVLDSTVEHGSPEFTASVIVSGDPDYEVTILRVYDPTQSAEAVAATVADALKTVFQEIAARHLGV